MTWLADHSLRVAALVLVVGAGSLLARRASAQSRLFLWTVVLYTAAAMPILAAVLPDVSIPVVFSNPVIVVPGPDAVLIEPALQAGAALASSQSATAVPWVLATYLAVAGFLFTRIIAGMRQTTRVLRRARPCDDTSLVAEVQALSSSMRLRSVPRVLQHASVHVPFVCGLFRPALVLPDSWETWDNATRQAVLTHELSHIVRRDLWTMRAASLYRAAAWINPMSWWLRRRIATLADRASDEAVLAAGVDPTTYAEVLVQFFDAAQRAPGRASWQLAMARRGAGEAGRRVGRVLNAPEGGNVRFGMTGRVLVGVAVVLAAVPAIVLSASRLDAVSIQPAPTVDRGLENQAALRETQAPVLIAPPPLEVKRPISEMVKTAPVIKPQAPVVPQPQAQAQEPEQEPEPWRSTRKATDVDVVAPRTTVQVFPKYTADAMRAKIQGMVVVEAIVSPEGNVIDARVIKSLDKVFGLDQEALTSARQWKFVPGTYQGQTVAVRVMINLEFALH